jgi:ribonuclease G
VRPERNIKTQEENPNKNGEVEAPIVLLEQIEARLKKVMEDNPSGIALHVHSFVASYLTCGLKSIQMKWFFKYRKWITVISRYAYPYLKFEFFDKNDEIIR